MPLTEMVWWMGILIYLVTIISVAVVIRSIKIRAELEAAERNISKMTEFVEQQTQFVKSMTEHMNVRIKYIQSRLDAEGKDIDIPDIH